MNPEQKAQAWELYYLLHDAVDLLWKCFEEPFVEDCLNELHAEEHEKAMSRLQEPDDFSDDDLPF